MFFLRWRGFPLGTSLHSPKAYRTGRLAALTRPQVRMWVRTAVRHHVGPATDCRALQGVPRIGSSPSAALTDRRYGLWTNGRIGWMFAVYILCRVSRREAGRKHSVQEGFRHGSNHKQISSTQLERIRVCKHRTSRHDRETHLRENTRV